MNIAAKLWRASKILYFLPRKLFLNLADSHLESMPCHVQTHVTPQR